MSKNVKEETNKKSIEYLGVQDAQDVHLFGERAPVFLHVSDLLAAHNLGAKAAIDPPGSAALQVFPTTPTPSRRTLASTRPSPGASSGDPRRAAS